jgi:SOS-response transcriptional repressor LexA
MHTIQQKLLALAEKKNMGNHTLREIGGFVGETSPQKIKHHLQQLEKHGFIHINKMEHTITTTKQQEAFTARGILKNAKLLSIPILGAANAGPATIFANANIEGYLRVSSTLLDRPRLTHRLFALKVDGPSMNMAYVGGKKIENGDYVIIDSEDREAANDDIVLSVIEGMANIKKYYVDKENNQILLMSESTHDFPAIHIHEDDDFSVNGKVIGVIKTPKRK